MLSDAAFHSFALYYFPRFGALRTTLRLTRGAIESACRNSNSNMTVGLSTLRKIEKGVQQRGLTVVPLEVYFAGSKVKVAIALGRGKKLHDKRDTVKKREADRKARDSRDR